MDINAEFLPGLLPGKVGHHQAQDQQPAVNIAGCALQLGLHQVELKPGRQRRAIDAFHPVRQAVASVLVGKDPVWQRPNKRHVSVGLNVPDGSNDLWRVICIDHIECKGLLCAERGGLACFDLYVEHAYIAVARGATEGAGAAVKGKP